MTKATEDHYKRVEIERKIREELLAVFRTAEQNRSSYIVQSDADAIPFTKFLIEAVQERLERGKKDAAIVPEF